MWKLSILTIIAVIFLALAADREIPKYIKQCKRSDPQLVECFMASLNHLRPYLAKGIPEIEMPSIEPFILDHLSLQLTDGPQGYKITMKNIEVYGATNFDVQSVKFSDGDKPFEAVIAMPKLTIETKYTSSGVLIIIPASGGGEFHAVIEGIVANLQGKVSWHERSNGTYVHLDTLTLDLALKSATMSISKAFNNNRILTEATNLFLRENGVEVMRAMQPQLQKKLAQEFAKIANKLARNVPVELALID